MIDVIGKEVNHYIFIMCVCLLHACPLLGTGDATVNRTGDFGGLRDCCQTYKKAVVVAAPMGGHPGYQEGLRRLMDEG